MPGFPHPQVAALLNGILKQEPNAVPTIQAARNGSIALIEPLSGPGEPVAAAWDSVADTAHGPVPLRWYRPSASQPDALLVYVHGGGWVAGSLDTHDSLCRALALRSGFLVVSIGYSLSPEAVFPQAQQEVNEILLRAPALAEAAGFHTRTLAVAGDSAGAQLLGVALHALAADRLPMPDAAVFIYPVTDATMSAPSWRTLADGYSLTAERMRWFWTQYLGEEAMRTPDRLTAPDISPLYSDRLAAFPRSMVITAEFDLLRDEGRQFAEKLAAQGVAAQHLHVPGQIHSFIRFRKVLTDPQWGADAVCGKIAEFLKK
ncbi:MAG: alpha/beta hydrolase [Herbaspirillum sp.]|jgi:acetyl esterase|nr:alpha/beta hydrolase [Herbaspirillum sp.]